MTMGSGFYFRLARPKGSGREVAIPFPSNYRYFGILFAFPHGTAVSFCLSEVQVKRNLLG